MQQFREDTRLHGDAVPSADEFLRLLSKLAADAARREEARRVEEMRRRERARVRARIAHREDALYIISIAAKLADMHPQTLRKYDRTGLVSPSRSQGSRRLYSEEDLERLQIVRRLTEDLGLNLNGVSLILELVALLKGMLQVLESQPELAGINQIQAVSEQIRVIIRYLGVED